MIIIISSDSNQRLVAKSKDDRTVLSNQMTKYKKVYDVNFYYKNELKEKQVIKTQVESNTPDGALKAVKITYNLYDVLGRYVVKELDQTKF